MTSKEEEMRRGKNVIASSLVKVLLQPAEASIFHLSPVQKNLSRNMQIRDLKTLCMRLFGLPVSRMNLLYNDGMMPISIPLDDDFASLDFFGFSQDGTSVVRVQGLEGDNDADNGNAHQQEYNQ
ncbi:cap-gly domain-containing protein [Cystoisospora suis]|uniref:Cap-gly domain-containing protein n=1 Tax=Cystoisospora suis TaxID=483139 RepID=A0A2C6KRX6_9APIC|nr:cap-gly domain-containing protein [Cystoisospora suis]